MILLGLKDLYLIRGVLPPIISKYDFETVQRIMRLDTRATPGVDTVNLFSGMLICGCCDGNITRKITTHNRNVYIYDRCSHGKKNGCRIAASIREDTLMTQVFEQVEAYPSILNGLGAREKATSLFKSNTEFLYPEAGALTIDLKKQAMFSAWK